MGTMDSDIRMPHIEENDIRPDNLMSEQAVRYAADLAKLLQFSNDFVAVDCPACGGDESVPEFDKAGINYVTCTDCRTLFTNPRPKPEHLKEYYENSENYQYWAKHVFPASEDARRERIFRPRVRRILELLARFNVDTDVLVEVGPGFGTFCEEMSLTGGFNEIIAIEPTPELAESCRKRGIEVIEMPVEEVDASRLPAVSVVASFEAIEHLFDPLEFVRACYSLLSPGGLLVVTCPNGAGFEVSELRELSGTVDAEHLNYFNPASLSRLVGRAGFETVEVSTPGRLDAELVRKHALDGSWQSDRSPFLKAVLVEEWDRLGQNFQDFLVQSNMSSHMWLVARKP